MKMPEMLRPCLNDNALTMCLQVKTSSKQLAATFCALAVYLTGS